MATAPDNFGNPIFAGRALTPVSASYDEPRQPKSKAVPPVIAEIISKLGLRYRPLSGAADLEAHAEALKLLCEDVADMPPTLLDQAARQWARENRWMPKASELRDLARAIRSSEARGSDFALEQLQAHCDKLNEGEMRMGSSRRWKVTGDASSRQVSAITIQQAA